MWRCSCCKYWSWEGSRPQKQLFYGVYSCLAHNESGLQQFDVHFRSQHGLENKLLINSHCWQLWNILNIWFIPLCYTPVSQHCYPITHGVHLTFSLQIYRGKERYIWRNESCGVLYIYIYIYIYYMSYGIYHLMFEGLACDISCQHGAPGGWQFSLLSFRTVVCPWTSRQRLSWGLSCLTIRCSLGFNKGSVKEYLIWWIAYAKDLCAWMSWCKGEAIELTELYLHYMIIIWLY